MSKLKIKLAGRARKLDEVLPQRYDDDADLLRGGVFFKIDIDLIKPNPYQPRKFFDAHKLED